MRNLQKQGLDQATIEAWVKWDRLGGPGWNRFFNYGAAMHDLSIATRDTIVVRPLMWLSDRALWRVLDARIVDGVFVNGSAALLRGFGRVGSLLQTGSVKTYMFIFVIGALVVLRAMTG